jgi:hypothetical protein
METGTRNSRSKPQLESYTQLKNIDHPYRNQDGVRSDLGMYSVNNARNLDGPAIKLVSGGIRKQHLISSISQPDLVVSLRQSQSSVFNPNGGSNTGARIRIRNQRNQNSPLQSSENSDPRTSLSGVRKLASIRTRGMRYDNIKRSVGKISAANINIEAEHQRKI